MVSDFLEAVEEAFLIKTGALDQITDAIITVDNEDRLIYLNKAAAEQYAIDKNKALGLKLKVLYRQLWFTPDAEQEAALSLKEKGYYQGTNVHVRPKGQKAVIESVVTVLKDKSGNKVGLMSIMRDITDRVNVADWLVESNQRLNYAIEASGMMIYEIDPKTNKINIIRGLEELLGYSPEEVQYSVDWWINQILPEDVPKAKEQFYPTKNVNNIVNEYHIHHKKGNYIVVRGIAKIIKDTTGKRVRIIGGMQNITQYKEMQAKLEEYAKNLEGLVEEKTKQLTNAQVKLEEYAKNLEKLVEERTMQLQHKERLATIGQIAGMVGHDIRNPLQAIVNELYFAKQTMTQVPENKNKQDTLESISIIQEQVDYISKIVTDLQDYAKTLKPEIKEVDLPELIASSFSIIKVPENIVLTVNIEDHLKMRTDPTFIRRTLTNLVNNAIQAMPKGGKLTITASQKENQTTITVEDTGKGIPEEIKPKLFTPLFTTKSKGQGFGLAVTKRLIEALGGTISFESEAGKGTIFFIKFSPKTKR